MCTLISNTKSFVGAAHIHGTLWLDLKKLENLQYRDGKLVNSKFPGPMKGLLKAFKKLKNSEKLLPEDTDSLANFI